MGVKGVLLCICLLMCQDSFCEKSAVEVRANKRRWSVKVCVCVLIAAQEFLVHACGSGLFLEKRCCGSAVKI